MRKRFFIAFLSSVAGAGVAHAGCPQTVSQVAVNPNAQYTVQEITDDNRLEVLVNGSAAVTWNGPSATPPPYNVSALFAQQRTNTVELRGYNQAYGAGWHDSNPGDVGYILTNVEALRCGMSDWRGSTDYLMFDTVYTFVDPRYGGEIKRSTLPRSDTLHLARKIRIGAKIPSR